MNRLRRAVANLAYGCLFIIAFPWLIWRRFTGKSRRGWRQKYCGLARGELQLNSATKDQPTVWLHAVSVGEVNLLLPMIESLASRATIVISTTTETGYDLAQDKYRQFSVFFFPFDFTWSVRRTLRSVAPDLVVLAELEIWPNLISIAHQENIPIVVANGRLSESSFRTYRKFRWLTQTPFQQLTHVAAQNETYAGRFIEAGCYPENVTVTGSIKFDNAQLDPENSLTKELAEMAGLDDDAFLFVAGSTQLVEDILVAEVFLQLKPKYPQLHVVLVPRHPERCPQLYQELKRLGIDFVIRSELQNSSVKPIDFLVVDVIGELGGWWGRANVGYVGGTMDRREGQNMIEPAAYGVPVCFGPRYKNFRDVVEQLLAVEGAEVIHDAEGLSSFVLRCLTQPEVMQTMGTRAADVVYKNRGATEKTISILETLVPELRRMER
ncbi:MAG: glycosyltransferase N-terminal domain-containing protein [Planctomycetota bacterium]